MREGWFGDRYDHLKWSVVLKLADKKQTILYVVMLRKTIKSKRAMKSCDANVTAFFQSLESPRRRPSLQRILELDSRIRLFDSELPEIEQERLNYFQLLRDVLEPTDRNAYCVFLDPDTGPSQKASGEHLSSEELRGIWEAMRKGDRLVVYQHGWRPKGGDWHSIAQVRMASALGIDYKLISQEPQHKTNVSFLTTVKCRHPKP